MQSDVVCPCPRVLTCQLEIALCSVEGWTAHFKFLYLPFLSY